MLARERRRHADTAAGGCTELAAALAALPSRPLEMVADAVVALDCDDDDDEAEDGSPGGDVRAAQHWSAVPLETWCSPAPGWLGWGKGKGKGSPGGGRGAPAGFGSACKPKPP